MNIFLYRGDESVAPETPVAPVLIFVLVAIILPPAWAVVSLIAPFECDDCWLTVLLLDIITLVLSRWCWCRDTKCLPDTVSKAERLSGAKPIHLYTRSVQENCASKVSSSLRVIIVTIEMFTPLEVDVRCVWVSCVCVHVLYARYESTFSHCQSTQLHYNSLDRSINFTDTFNCLHRVIVSRQLNALFSHKRPPVATLSLYGQLCPSNYLLFPTPSTLALSHS